MNYFNKKLLKNIEELTSIESEKKGNVKQALKVCEIFSLVLATSDLMQEQDYIYKAADDEWLLMFKHHKHITQSMNNIVETYFKYGTIYEYKEKAVLDILFYLKKKFNGLLNGDISSGEQVLLGSVFWTGYQYYNFLFRLHVREVYEVEIELDSAEELIEDRRCVLEEFKPNYKRFENTSAEYFYFEVDTYEFCTNFFDEFSSFILEAKQVLNLC